MTVTLDLNPEMERELRQEAARAGLDTNGFILNTLHERLRRDLRAVPHLSRTETALLETISAAWPAETQARFDALVTKRRARKITPVELAELNSLTDQSEILTAERVRAVGELARLRGLTFDEMWRRLGINA
jgi:hypothetical protein